MTTLNEFIDTYQVAITDQVIESYPPQYQPALNHQQLPQLYRTPKGGQYDAIQGTILSLQNHPGTNIVAEMGTGKSYISLAAAHTAGFTRVIILCPPHLTTNWQDEIKMTIPGARHVIVKSITDLEHLRKSFSSGPLYVIMSREKAKLSYHWQPAINWKWASDSEGILRHPLTKQPWRIPTCPDCNKEVTGKDDLPMTEKQLDKNKLTCKNCGGALWSASKAGPRRYPLADYIKNRFKNFFELLIADEVHEYKGKGSAQGIAGSTIANACKRTLTLTGTLMGGYSSTLFHLLYRFSPEIRNSFESNEEGKWIQRYGFIERTTKYSGDSYDDGRSSKRKNYRTSTKEIPGLAPPALFHIIDNSIFLRLPDVADDLPTYDEEIILSDMDCEADHTGYSQATAYQYLYFELYEAMKAALIRGSKKLLAIYLQTLLAYPDGCTRGETARDPENGELIASVPPLDRDKEYPKETELIELVKQEKAAGRKVMVFATHTMTRDITERMKEALERNHIRTAVLKSNTTAPDKRAKWIETAVQQGLDVLICHPKLVQTGLNLIQFPTIIWFETEYSVYTMRQASRRSWRIGQTNPVKVIFMAYKETIQTEALKLIAKKIQASLAVEGELPEDGLSSFGDNGENLMMALAKQIINNGEDSESVYDAFKALKVSMDREDDLLVRDDYNRLPPPKVEAPEPEPVAVPAGATKQKPDPEPEPEPKPEPQKSFTWDEFMQPANGKPKPAGQSLFEWAMS